MFRLKHEGQAAMITAKALAQGAAYRNSTDGPSKGYTGQPP
jgi:hypothetical protein